MKIHLKFNHNAKSVLEAIDSPYNRDEANDIIHDCIKKFVDDDSASAPSQFAEIIHNELDYSIILYLALVQIREVIENAKVKKYLKDILDDEDI